MFQKQYIIVYVCFHFPYNSCSLSSCKSTANVTGNVALRTATLLRLWSGRGRSSSLNNGRIGSRKDVSESRLLRPSAWVLEDNCAGCGSCQFDRYKVFEAQKRNYTRRRGTCFIIYVSRSNKATFAWGWLCCFLAPLIVLFVPLASTYSSCFLTA